MPIIKNVNLIHEIYVFLFLNLMIFTS